MTVEEALTDETLTECFGLPLRLERRRRERKRRDAIVTSRPRCRSTRPVAMRLTAMPTSQTDATYPPSRV
jgi:hypothetical protein